MALDDFGTGYSSLTYLKKLPIDIVKIDKEFISNALNEKVDEKIVNTIINLNHELNLKVVAEGIETKEQLNFLRETGCDFGQGFLFSKAIPAEDFERLLKEEKYYF
nr:EAL domain-containing protein [Desnuesiella massiliensis]